jgi:hypothetical protein
MPSTSKKQQNWMRMVAAQQAGSLKGASPEIKKAAKQMSKLQVHEFASGKIKKK